MDSFLSTLLVFLFWDLCIVLEEYQSLYLVLSGNDHFSSVLLLEPRFFFLRLPVVILETLGCGRKQFSAAVLPQDEY